MALKTDKIHEGNKLIAEFMGWTLKRYPSHMKTPYHGRSVWWSSGETKTFCCEEGREHFDESWEWLMPVVNRCYNSLATTTNVRKSDRVEWRISNIDFITNNIDGVWTSVVEFIKWYNQFRENGK
jgi:hypothetical protein